MPRANSVKPAKWRPPKERGKKNKTETRFEQNVLWARRAAGEVEDWAYEAIKFRLADGAWYTPDFVVYLADGTIEIAEVKGSAGWEEASRVRIKVAGETHSRFVFRGYTERRGERGVFDVEEF